MANLNPVRNSVIASWSGGKDSCLACYKAIKQGYKVKYLLNFISKKYKRGCFHGIEAKLMNLQAELIGIPLIQKEVSPDMKKYEQEFKEAVSKLKSKSIKAMVFGDIALEEHKAWIERVCEEIKIKSIEPLWKSEPIKITEEFIDLGFKSIVVSAKAKLFNKEWIGHQFDREFLDYLKSKKIDICGENGEFHTFVVDGPVFKKRIEITKSQPVFKKGFWKYWFLDIQKWQVKNK